MRKRNVHNFAWGNKSVSKGRDDAKEAAFADLRTSQLRWFVFNIWYISLVVIIVSFIVSYGQSLVPLPFGDVLRSASLVLGLVLPILSMMLAFYAGFDTRRRHVSAASKDFVMITIYSSVLYHVLLWTCVVYGVVFYGFDRVADGDSLYRNCTAVVHVMSLFSVLLGPTTWLFGGPETPPPEARGSSDRTSRPSRAPTTGGKDIA